MRAPSQRPSLLARKRPLRYASASNKPSSGAAFGATTATHTHVISRHPFVLGSTDWAELVLCFTNHRLQANSANGVVLNTNAYNVVAVAVEIGSTARLVYFGGQRSTVIPIPAPGAVKVLSDPLLPAQFGLPWFARGTTGFLRVWISVDTGTHGYPNVGVPGGTHSIKQRRFDPTKVQVNNIDGTGELSYTMINGGVNGTDATDPNQAACPMILGRAVSGDAHAVMIIGDSKAAGVGDTATVMNVGGLARALLPNATVGTGATAGANFGVSASVASDWANGAAYVLDDLMQYATHAIEQYGTNGLVVANSQAIHTRLRNAGVRKIIRTSLTPKTNHPPTLAITSLTSAGTTATATVASTANLVSGQSYPISGATPSGYNLTAAITVVDPTTFTYTVASGLASPATGTIVLNDQYRTEALQTPVSGWNAGGSADNFENSMEALPATDPDMTFYDPAALRASADGGSYWKWRVNGTANYATADGVHETPAGYELNVDGVGNIITAAGTTTGSLRSLIQALG